MAISEPKSAHLREVLLFAFNWKKSASEAYRMLEEVYNDHTLSKSQCYRWFKKFQSGDFELDNEPHGKPPQKFEDAELQALLDEDSTQIQEQLAKQLQVSQGHDNHESPGRHQESQKQPPNIPKRIQFQLSKKQRRKWILSNLTTAHVPALIIMAMIIMILRKAFKDDCISRSQSGKWHKAFKEGREEVADEPRSGRPTTSRTDENVDRVLEVLRTDRRLSIQQIADTLHMSTFVVHGIVTEDLQMRKVCAKLVPKVLTQDQKELRVLRCQELLDLIQNELDLLNSVVTGDESWMFEYDPESKRQSCAWHTKSSPRPKKARMSKSRIKTMIIVFFDIRGIVHCERSKRRIARVRTDIKDTVKLHHDNAISHTAFIITNFLARSNTPVIPHPPYSPDLAP
ncbi:hypothetical protein LAZ67_9003364 [Cordylochernes scorpioides]|uniref:Mos1 transposase HTH domain-containing protein n=1 Tax=Cordylochernes scorpioides TaxID=51811 RepID=A0ABY6KUF1_9ARAC|nr:hypothetical protein LAZ67_9003364 [Cordylochernes scorpioides]